MKGKNKLFDETNSVSSDLSAFSDVELYRDRYCLNGYSHWLPGMFCSSSHACFTLAVPDQLTLSPPSRALGCVLPQPSSRSSFTFLSMG